MNIKFSKKELKLLIHAVETEKNFHERTLYSSQPSYHGKIVSGPGIETT